MIDKAIEIITQEWNNLRYFFEMCGDIGEFNPQNFLISKWHFEQEPEWFISNVIEMDRKFPQYGYATPEALNVFTVLASKSAEKLGLRKELASAFGMSYASIRTGLVAYRTEPKQILFYKMFFPLGMGFSWDVDPPLVRTKFKIIFDRFATWQSNPQIYDQDFAQFESVGRAWREWEELSE